MSSALVKRGLGALAWGLAAYMAYVFLWYLQYKWTANPGSVELFQTLSDWIGLPWVQPYFRIGTGLAEFIAAILLFIPATQPLGAALGVGIMSGAIFFHVASPLGIDPYHDGAVLFREAVTVWLSGLIILALRRTQITRMLTGLRAILG